jgi:hypothetical protein
MEKMNMGQTREPVGKPRRKIKMLIAALVLSFFYTAGFTGHTSEAASAGEVEKKSSAQIDFRRLEGRWVRPDGGYILELRNIQKDGSVAAAYFNPRPINVFRAEVSRKDGTITLFVELRDVNYPGSTYKLLYDAATDRLRGAYFQAVQGQIFDVEFVRVK